MTDIQADFSEQPPHKISRSGDLRKDWKLLAAFVLMIVICGLAVAYQVFLYRESFSQLQIEHKKREKLDDEWGRLLIEQQTFGAITQVGSNAVLRLQMYSPRTSEVVTLTKKMEQPRQSSSSSEELNSND